MKTKCACVVVVGVALFVSGCGSSPQDLIIGKWQAGQPGVTVTAEFSKGGQSKLIMFGKTLQGTYRVNGDDELEWTLNGKTTKCKLKVSATALEVTSDGKTVTYKKL